MVVSAYLKIMPLLWENEAIGRRIARENARNRIWALEDYVLRERLSK